MKLLYLQEVGCFEGQGSPSGEADSMEGYASGLVEVLPPRSADWFAALYCQVAWRTNGKVSFPGASRGDALELQNMRFGVQALPQPKAKDVIYLFCGRPGSCHRLRRNRKSGLFRSHSRSHAAVSLFSPDRPAFALTMHLRLRSDIKTSFLEQTPFQALIFRFPRPSH